MEKTLNKITKNQNKHNRSLDRKSKKRILKAKIFP
nr:MAG TPA: hypothetical protein [Caudoviricetes sp.]